MDLHKNAIAKGQHPRPLSFAALSSLFPFLPLARHLPPTGGSLSPRGKTTFSVSLSLDSSPEGRAFWRYGKLSHSDFKSAEAENTVKRSSRRTGVNLQYFRLEPTALGSERGEQPLSRCGERGVQRVRGGSRNTPLTLWPSGATRRKCILQKP